MHGTNDAPVANDDFATATEDVAGTTPSVFNVLTNDSDVDAGDSKTVTTFNVRRHDPDGRQLRSRPATARRST